MVLEGTDKENTHVPGLDTAGIRVAKANKLLAKH